MGSVDDKEKRSNLIRKPDLQETPLNKGAASSISGAKPDGNTASKGVGGKSYLPFAESAIERIRPDFKWRNGEQSSPIKVDNGRQ